MLFPPAPLVTLDVRATSLARALPLVGKAFGVAMRAAPAIGGEVVILSLRGADLAGFRARLAAAFAGEWSVDPDGTLVLNRSVRLREAEAAAGRAKRRGAVERWRAHNAELSAGAPTFGAAEARALRAAVDTYGKLPKPKEFSIPYARQGEALSGRTPARRAFVRALLGMPDGALVATDAQTRVVYSSRPTATQRPLPFDGAALARRYAAEANAWADATADLPAPAAFARWPRIDRRAASVAEPPALVTVAVHSSYGIAGVDLTMYDRDGRRVMTEGGFAGDDEWETEGERTKAREATEFEVALSPESRAFLEAFFPKEDGVGDPAKARPFFDVRARDPLSYAASDLLFSLARARGMSLVARAGDDLIDVGRGAERGKASTARLKYFGYEPRDEDGWTLLAPEDPGHAAVEFLPRDRLARMLEIAGRTGLREIEERAEVARLYTDPLEDPPIGERIVEFPFPLGYNREALALYGEMSEEARAGARRPEGVALGSLPKAARDLLGRIVFGSRSRFLFAPEHKDIDGEARWQALQETARGEITFALPNGLPADARVFLRDATVDAIRMGEGGFVDALTPAEAAEALWRERHPERFPGRTNDPVEKDALLPVRQRRLVLEVRLAPGLTYARTLTSEVREPGAAVKLADLPGRWGEAYRAAYAAVEAKWRGVPLPPQEPKEGEAPPPW